MFRSPFVWDVQIRRQLLDDELTSLRELSYGLWRDVVGRQMWKTTPGRDNRNYRIRIAASWMKDGSDDIRVVVDLQKGAFHRRLLRQSFTITPENRFRE
ncbi:MAG: hypothetical protein ABI818_19735 [Acidobacteriota bacterium]